MRADVAFAIEQYGMSERQACKLVNVDRSSYRYEPRPDHNAQLRGELLSVARQKPRYGYRRLQVLLERGGHYLRPFYKHFVPTGRGSGRGSYFLICVICG